MKFLIALSLVFGFAFYTQPASAQTVAQCKKTYKKCSRNPFKIKKCKKERNACEARANKQATKKAAPAAAKATAAAATTANSKNSPEPVLIDMSKHFDMVLKDPSLDNRKKYATFLSKAGTKRVMRGCKRFANWDDAKKTEKAKKYKIDKAEFDKCDINTMVASLAGDFDTFFYPLAHKAAKKTVNINGNKSDVTYVVQDGTKNDKLIYEFELEGGVWKFVKMSLRDP